MIDTDGDAYFPELTRCAHRLGLDEHAMAESLLCRLDNGEGYWTTLRDVVTDAVQRQGQYDGGVKARIDSGRVFLEAEGPKPPATPGRLIEALESEYIDVFDALAAYGAMWRRRGDYSEHARGRAMRLAKVEADEDEF